VQDELDNAERQLRQLEAPKWLQEREECDTDDESDTESPPLGSEWASGHDTRV